MCESGQKHCKKRAHRIANDHRSNQKRPIHIGFVEAAWGVSALLVIVGTILQMSKSHYLKIGAVWIFVAAFIIGSIAVGIKLTREITEPEPVPSSKEPHEPQLAHRPRFSEKIDGITIFVGSNDFTFSNMNNGHSEALRPAGGVTLATVRVVNDELVVDAKLGTLGAELRDNRLVHRPTGWDWQADENTFEIVNQLGNPVFQLEYLTNNAASIRGVFFKGDTLVAVNDIDMISIQPADPQLLDKVRIKPIFKYPSWKYPKQRR